MNYIVSGCIQGHGMDADKFYNVAWSYTADNTDDARRQGEHDGIFVESVVLEDKEC